MGFLDKFKKQNKILEPDKYAELIPYIEINKREFMMTTDLEKLKKDIEKNISKHIKKFKKMNQNEQKSMYDDVLDTKHNFVNNSNVWSRAGMFSDKMDIVVHAYEQLRDEIKKEMKEGL